jgi:hypothetical protein
VILAFSYLGCNREPLRASLTLPTFRWSPTGNGNDLYFGVVICGNLKRTTKMGSIQYTKELVNQVKAFISEGKEPAMARSSLYKFKKRFSDGTYGVKDRKLLHNGKVWRLTSYLKGCKKTLYICKRQVPK